MKTIALLLYFALSTAGLANQEKPYTFSEVELDKNQDTNGEENCSYSFTLKSESKHTISTGMDCNKFEPMMRKLNAKNAGEMIGKHLLLDTHAVEYSLVKAFEQASLNEMHGDKYQAPSVESIYNEASKALIKFECPNFKKIDSDTIGKAFNAQTINSTENSFLKKLRESLSQKGMWLNELKKVPEGILLHKGFAKYFVLRSKSKSMIVTLSSSKEPFECSDIKVAEGNNEPAAEENQSTSATTF